MWFLISRRLRAWLALSVAVPLLRWVLSRASRAATQRNPNSSLARVLRTADSAAARFGRRRKRR